MSFYFTKSKAVVWTFYSVMQVYIYSQFLQLVVRRDISSQLSIRRRKINNDGFEKNLKQNHSGQSCELSFQRVILKLLQQQLAIK